VSDQFASKADPERPAEPEPGDSVAGPAHAAGSVQDERIEPAVEAKSSLALKFRILKRRGWKGSFRLEEAFWQVLEDAAKSGSMKLSDYVKDMVERLDDSARNQSSALRVRAVEYLLERCRALEKLGDLQNIVGAALASPVPCFVLNAARKLVSHNREFYNLVASAAQQVAQGEVSSAHLTLDAPVPKLIDLLAQKPGSALSCGYSIRTNSQVLRGRARVALAMAQDQPVLVGYILESRTSS
jgi:predicted DNA-binding ribbon-helix-helix protein